MKGFVVALAIMFLAFATNVKASTWVFANDAKAQTEEIASKDLPQTENFAVEDSTCTCVNCTCASTTAQEVCLDGSCADGSCADGSCGMSASSGEGLGSRVFNGSRFPRLRQAAGRVVRFIFRRRGCCG